jgi:hypothetical protein
MSVSTQMAAVSPERTPAGSHTRSAPARDWKGPLWAQLFLPSLADIVFVALLSGTFGFLGKQLLSDSDVGWHVRNGEHILVVRSVPQVDYFSYTMMGRPWYAWEWLYDATIAGIHSVAGLNGVVLVSAFIFALTFALLFRLTLKLSGNLPVAVCLTLLSVAAASIHLLARPHLVTWLFTLLWFAHLDSFQRGWRRHLFALPLLMLLWVNLHGGFLVGVALQTLFLGGNLWTRSTASCRQRRERANERLFHLSIVLLLSLAATMLTPYGYRLHLHLHSYLSDRFLMDNISEFLSPNFHLPQVEAFALLLLLTLLALAPSKGRARGLDVLIIAFSTWAGLHATRNIPIASILLSLTTAPTLGAAVRDMKDREDIGVGLRRLATRVDGFSARMGAIEQRLTGHVLPAVATLLLLSSLSGRGAFSQTAMSLNFDEKQMPVQAVEFMAEHNIRGHFFSPDSWGGYLIYRLYPNVLMMVDDRHDFYGQAFLRDYLTVLHAGRGWRDLLDANQVNWVVVPLDSPLANALNDTGDWKMVHHDGTAIIFARASPLPAK